MRLWQAGRQGRDSRGKAGEHKEGLGSQGPTPLWRRSGVGARTWPRSQAGEWRVRIKTQILPTPQPSSGSEDPSPLTPLPFSLASLSFLPRGWRAKLP